MLTLPFASLMMFHLKLHFFLNLIIISLNTSGLTCFGDVTKTSASVRIHSSYETTSYIILKDHKADISSTSSSSLALMKSYSSKWQLYVGPVPQPIYLSQTIGFIHLKTILYLSVIYIAQRDRSPIFNKATIFASLFYQGNDRLFLCI